MNIRAHVASSLLALSLATLTAQGCSSNNIGSSSSGIVAGAEDSHCGTRTQTVDLASCNITGTTTKARLGILHEGHDEDAGDASAADGGADEEEFGATMYNAAGKDDDCKYSVSFTSTAVAANKDVTFTVSLKSILDAKGMTGADPYMENFLGDHIGPATTQAGKELGDGTYTIGPVVFDKSGRWTVRFHFYGQCEDGETSPHSHAAFFIDVP